MGYIILAISFQASAGVFGKYAAIAMSDPSPIMMVTNIFYLLWEYGFETLAAGWSSAAGMITFAGFSVIALVCLALMRRFAFHDD